MYKKIMIALLVCISLLIIAGCGEKDMAGGQAAAPIEPVELPPTEVEEIIEPSPVPVEVEESPVGKLEPEEPVEEVSKDIPAQIAELIEKAATRTNYKYMYNDGEYFVKGDKIHILLSENVGNMNDNSLYNEVLVDKTEKKAYAWCTDFHYCGDKVPDEYWEVDYAKYNKVTPTEQIMALSNAKVIQEATCENKECIDIEFVDDADGLTKRMWILTYKAVPWKVQWYDEAKGKQFSQFYQDLILVKDADVMIPSGYEFVEK